MLRHLAAAAVASILALPAAPPALAYEPTGELDLAVAGQGGGGATFDGDRVVGATVSMSRQETGGWAGSLAGRPIGLAVTPSRLAGAGVSLAVDRVADRLSVEGLFLGQRVRLQLGEKALSGRRGACSYDLKRTEPGLYVGDVGCLRGRRRAVPTTTTVTLRLTGQAGQPEPPLPQLVLALLAVLPG